MSPSFLYYHVLTHVEKDRFVGCGVPGCTNHVHKNSSRSFHHLPSMSKPKI